MPNRKPNRLKTHDYSNDGDYFLTINAKNNYPFFGEIVNGEVVLNNFGKIADRFINIIEKNYPQANIDEYVVMPNHIRIIIFIRNLQLNNRKGIQPQIRNDRTKMLISKIIQSYKTSVQKAIRNSINDKELSIWHTSFYDRIIRSEEGLVRVRKYIRNNPSQFEEKYGW